MNVFCVHNLININIFLDILFGKYMHAFIQYKHAVTMPYE